MKNNKLTTIEEQDDCIQSLDIAQLREMESRSNFLFQNIKSLQNDSNYDDLKYSNIDEYIKNLQLSELREIEKNSQLLEQWNEVDLHHKIKITWLDRNIIILIETKKEKATLEQIITYCNTLHIPYNEMLPELFIQTV